MVVEPDFMKSTFYATFDEGKGIEIGTLGIQSKPMMWFDNIDEFDSFINMIRNFRHSLPYLPDVFRKAFEE